MALVLRLHPKGYRKVGQEDQGREAGGKARESSDFSRAGRIKVASCAVLVEGSIGAMVCE